MSIEAMLSSILVPATPPVDVVSSLETPSGSVMDASKAPMGSAESETVAAQNDAVVPEIHYPEGQPDLKAAKTVEIAADQE